MSLGDAQALWWPLRSLGPEAGTGVCRVVTSDPSAADAQARGARMGHDTPEHTPAVSPVVRSSSSGPHSATGRVGQRLPRACGVATANSERAYSISAPPLGLPPGRKTAVTAKCTWCLPRPWAGPAEAIIATAHAFPIRVRTQKAAGRPSAP